MSKALKTVEDHLEADRDLIRRVMVYRDREGDNAFYMGSMAQAGMYSILKLRYGRDNFALALAAADRSQVDLLLDRAKHYIDYMMANPVSKCPCCGQIVPQK